MRRRMFAESQPRQQICTEEYIGRWNERAEEPARGQKRTSHAVLGTTGGRRPVVCWKLLEVSFRLEFPCSYENRPHGYWAPGWCEITGTPLWEAGESKVCCPGYTTGRNPRGESPKKTLDQRALCSPGPLLLHGATIPRTSWRPQRPWPQPDTENWKPRGPGLQ